MLELLQKNLRLLFFCPAERLGDWLPCVTRPAGLALLRLCAALRLVNPPLRVPFLPLAKNEACQGFVSRRCQAELHTLQRCCNVLHTATAVLHFLQALSDLARRSKAKTAEALFPSSFHYAATSR